MRKLLASLLLLSGIAGQPAHAQELKIPDPSTTQKIEQDFGLGRISISYSRPNTKGRKIFDGMEPYGIVWRTGANSATVIKLTDTVMIAGHQLLPGEYSLFSIPAREEWTIIFNKTARQWGAYSYDSSKDVLRFKIRAAKPEKPVETFTIQFANVFPDHAELHLIWENTDLSIPLAVDVDARVMANIDEAMKGEKKPMYQAAIYYYNHNKDMTKALAWMTEVDKTRPNAYNVKYWKARIQLKKGDKADAIASANEGLKLATAENNAEYIRLSKEVLADAARQ